MREKRKEKFKGQVVMMLCPNLKCCNENVYGFRPIIMLDLLPMIY